MTTIAMRVYFLGVFGKESVKTPSVSPPRQATRDGPLKKGEEQRIKSIMGGSGCEIKIYGFDVDKSGLRGVFLLANKYVNERKCNK